MTDGPDGLRLPENAARQVSAQLGFSGSLFGGCGLCRYAKLEWINKNQDKEVSRRQYR